MSKFIKQSKGKIKFDFVMPHMSWEVPIEQEIITFCNHMASAFRRSEAHHRETGWFANNSFSEQCGAMAKAYETVANHVIKEVALRKKIKSI